MADAKPPGPAGAWCPMCGLYPVVNGCTAERCATIDTLPPAELLRHLAEDLTRPRWFDTDAGGRAAAQMHDRVVAIAAQLAPAPAAPVEARVAESAPPINSRPEIGPVNRRAEVDAWPAIGAPAAAGPGAATVEDAATVSAAGAIAQPTPEPLPLVASRGELGAPLPLPRPQCLHPGCTRPAKQDPDHGPYRKFCDEHGPAATEHPAPWTWDGIYLFDDAHGVVLELCVGDVSPRARALTEAAPEMEALLLKRWGEPCKEQARWKRDQQDMGDRRDWDGLEASGDEPVECEKCWSCRVRSLLARDGLAEVVVRPKR